MGSAEKVSWKRVLILAGAIIAFTIGSGFATGQEIIQYYTAYGVKGLLVILVFLVAFLYYNFNFAKAGAEQKFEKGNDVYKHFCGKYVGTFCDYYSTLFCYMSFFVMVGGASSTLHQEYGLPAWVGGVVLTALAVITVVGGLNSMVDAIGAVGPVIVVLCIAIGVITLIRDGGDVGAGLDIIKNAAYEGAANGETIKSAGSKELNYGIIGGTVAVCVAIAVVMFAQISNINTPMIGSSDTFVWNADIPNLILAAKIWKPFSAIFAIIVFAGIYTTAVPLLYNPCGRFAKEGTSQFKILTVALGVSGLIVGLFLPFRVLVNIIYVLNGYVGAVLILFMLWKNIKDVFLKKK